MRSRIDTVPSSEFRDIVLSSRSLREILLKIGVSYRGHTYKTLQARLDREGLSSFYKRRVIRNYSNADIFCENSPVTCKLKAKYLSYSGVPDVCVLCGQGPEHNGIPLTLQLDHINGNHTDNRLSNLRILCPNCHTQTNTYGSRNNTTASYLKSIASNDSHLVQLDGMSDPVSLGVIKKMVRDQSIDSACSALGITSVKELTSFCRSLGIKVTNKTRPTKFDVTYDELKHLVSSMPMTSVGAMFGVSSNAIKKRCLKLGIELPPMRGVWSKRKHSCG